ncbi:MAG: ABC transporter ATP-binding protein [Actinobacteria bacterium]|nr:ABC transporter ATP-binding protein [Actinomycetota bacterium]
MSAALALRGVTVGVPDGGGVRTLLDAVALELAPGEVVAIAGASGSGKSTLLAVAGLLRRADAGEVEIAGVAAAGLSERRRGALRAEHVGIVFQSANLLPSLTAGEQLEMVARIRGERGREVRARARELLAEVGLADRAGQLPGELSGGERQRVGIARALMSRPSLLLADEPTAALDAALSAEIATLLVTTARGRGIACLLASHDEAPLASADRLLELRGGALRESTPLPG